MSLFSECPTWLDESAWQAYCEWRKSLPKKQRMTDYARSLILMKLAKLREQGNDPTAVIQQSLVNCWLDVYPIKTRELQTVAANADGFKASQEVQQNRELTPDEIRAAARRAREKFAVLRRAS